jgi:hypothetical protein
MDTTSFPPSRTDPSDQVSTAPGAFHVCENSELVKASEPFQFSRRRDWLSARVRLLHGAGSRLRGGGNNRSELVDVFIERFPYPEEPPDDVREANDLAR